MRRSHRTRASGATAPGRAVSDDPEKLLRAVGSRSDSAACGDRRAFRRGISTYHPDKVRHLGSELQRVAAERAAECTQAYRTLSDPILRAEYDARVAVAVMPPGNGPGFGRDRSRAHELVRRAAVARVRRVLERTVGPCDEPVGSGFDLACAPPRRERWRRNSPRLLGRVVTAIDAAAMEDSWMRAWRFEPGELRDVCVLLMASTIAPDLDLAKASDRLGRRPTRSGSKLTVVTLNVSTWSAHVPADAPAAVLMLMERLMSDSRE